VEQLCQQWALAIEALNNATNSTKPSTSWWRPGQKVWLEAKNLALPYGTVKLASRWHRPFTITKVISPVAYKLHLPPQWVIHPVFHASLLTLYVETVEHGENFSKPPLDLIGGEEHYEVVVLYSQQPNYSSFTLKHFLPSFSFSVSQVGLA